jgi:short subunit dehydrogenase-like uncharacterized protein
VTSSVVVYGATGYTGALIAEAMVSAGITPLLAGRNALAVEALASRLGVPWRAVSLDDARGLDALLSDATLVLHCAGPFYRTMAPMVDACLRTRTHYLDITGEIQVFETCAARDAAARAAGVMLLPGVGFDVVPSDCLAAHTAARLPGATELVLAFHNTAGLSRGTATTMIELAHTGGMIRRDGVLARVPPAFHTRTFDFGRGPRMAVTIPWGDVSTAFHSTGIGNVRVYKSASPSAVRTLKLTGFLAPLLRMPWVQRQLIARATQGGSGPDEAARRTGRSHLICEVREGTGRVAVSRLTGPEGYTMTVATAINAVRAVLARPDVSGFATPSRVFGADFVLQVPGVTRTDEPITAA